MPKTPFSVKVYRRLLGLYPVSFREEYAGPMEQAYRDELAAARGFLGIATLWLRLIFDLAISIPLQLAAEAQTDARHAFRLWAAHPWHTGFTIAALALAIGANTGIFSVVNALLLRSLPFRDADRLAALEFFQPPHDSVSQFDQWRKHSAYLADAALFEDADFNIGRDRMVRAHAAQTSNNFFTLLGTQAAIGRTFLPEDREAAVIGYGLWQELFAGDEHVLGSTLLIGGNQVTVVGVAPPDFAYPNNCSVWKTAVFASGNNGWAAIARLKRGITWSQARAAFATEAPRLWPLRPIAGHEHFARMVPLRDELAGPVKRASLVLFIAVGLILLIACANVANVLLARTADRSMELAIRSAVGASPARLIQQILTECLLLAIVSAAAGIAIAWWATSLAAKVEPSPLPTQTYSVLDWHVLVFCAGVALLSAVFFGLLPSLSVGRVHRFAGGSIGTRRSRLVREALVATQVMLTVVLLAGSVSVGRAFARLVDADRGFDTQSPVTVSVSIQGTRRGIKGNQLGYFEEVLARIRKLPGVQSASETDFLPLSHTGFVGGPLGIDGQPPKGNANLIPVFGSYFSTMGVRLLYGREFTGADVRSSMRVAVVNETFAREFARPRDVVGRLVTIPGARPWKIIGVVKGMDFMTEWLTGEGDGKGPEVFVPAEHPGDFTSTFVARVRSNPEEYVPIIRDAIQSVDPTVPVFSAKTMRDRLDEALARPRFYRTALLFFAGFGVLLALIGVYGVVSYTVARRTREMGVRLALGTTPNRVRVMVLGQGLIAVFLGLVCGAIVSTASGRFLASLFEGANSIGAAAFGVSAVLLYTVAALSIWLATRRIARMDVMEILRTE